MRKMAFSKLKIALFCIMMTIILPGRVYAAEDGAVSVLFKHDNKPVSGETFNIYYVADRSQDGNYNLAGEFAKYPVSLKNTDADSLNILASTLSAYVSRDGIAALAEMETNEYGACKTDNLKDGLYLVTGNVFTADNITYYPKPLLVSVPTRTPEGDIVYDVAVEPKYEFTEGDAEDSYVTRSVLKIWNDKNNKNRPGEVTVQLLCDGAIYAEQTLNADNNWRYTWDNLKASCNWQLVEKDVPDGYSVGVEQQGITYTVTNTYDVPDSPAPGTTGSPDDSTKADDNGSSKKRTGSSITDINDDTDSDKDTDDTSGDVITSEALPQTGMLWWPVPILAGAGIILIITGILLGKRRGGIHG